MWRGLFLLIFILSCGGSPDQKTESFTGVMWQSAMKGGASCQWHGLFKGVPEPYLAFLWGSYGKDSSCLVPFLQSNPHSKIRVYLSNGVCIRKGNCSRLEAASISDILGNAKEATKLIKDNCPDCELELVLQLEDNLLPNHACLFAEKLNDEGFLYVERNPVDESLLDSGCFSGYELHNSTNFPGGSSRRIWSNDGKNLLLQEYDFRGLHIDLAETRRVRDQIGRSSSILLWHALGNCLHGDTTDAPYPYLRTCEDRPDIIKAINEELLLWQH